MFAGRDPIRGQNGTVAICVTACIVVMTPLCPIGAREFFPSALVSVGATTEFPFVVSEGVESCHNPSRNPIWAEDRLLTDPASDLALARFERYGEPVWDPTSGAFYVWANGALVRLDGTRAVVVMDGILGRDLDIRARLGLVVSREPDHSIVLWDLGGTPERRRLLRGSDYFRPRFSPNGQAILVQRSGVKGGGLLLVSLDGNVRDLGSGSDGVFTPDGQGVVFAMVSSDGLRITGADLYHLDLPSGVRTRLTATVSRAEIAPAISPDGRFIAFVDAFSGHVLVTRMPAPSSQKDF